MPPIKRSGRSPAACNLNAEARPLPSLLTALKERFFFAAWLPQYEAPYGVAASGF